jgi:hypothetical protein
MPPLHKIYLRCRHCRTDIVSKQNMNYKIWLHCSFKVYRTNMEKQLSLKDREYCTVTITYPVGDDVGEVLPHGGQVGLVPCRPLVLPLWAERRREQLGNIKS